MPIRVSSLFLLISFFAIIPSGHAAPTTKPVIGGSSSTAKYPWMVALLRAEESDSTEAQFCGASLIASQYLATAAHCVTSFGEVVDPSFIEVMVGENVLPFGVGNRQKVIGVFPHPKFNPVTLENDVALIKLAKPLAPPFLRVLQPGEEALISEGAKGKLLGWGMTHPELPILPVNLQEVELPIHSDANCLASLGRWFKPLSMLCAGVLSSSSTVTDGKDACFGDSGGPLVVSTSSGDALAATVSWGFGCANSFAYGVYGDAIQLATFLNSRPVARPIVKGEVNVEGTGLVGQPLRCVDTGLTTSGDPVVSKSFLWFNSSGDGIFPIAVGQEYVPVDFDVDTYLTCQIDYSNEGGTTSAYSSNGSYVSSSPITPTPTVTPSVNTVPDQEGPVVSVIQKSCSKKVCKIIVDATDSSGVLGVEALYNKQAKASSTCKGKGCIKTSSGTLAATSVGDTKWLFTFNVPKKGTLKLQLQVRAIDALGNVSLDAAVTTLRYRAS